jgi:hypothetical protein
MEAVKAIDCNSVATKRERKTETVKAIDCRCGTTQGERKISALTLQGRYEKKGKHTTGPHPSECRKGGRSGRVGSSFVIIDNVRQK